MYNAVIRDTYAQLFKLAEAKLPQFVREATVKVASVEPVVSKALSDRWSKT
jgi:hypothetical protein